MRFSSPPTSATSFQSSRGPGLRHQWQDGEGRILLGQARARACGCGKMTGFGRILAAAVMLSVPAATSAAKPAAKAAAKADWTRTFAVTPAGGFRVGNPKAKVAIVEYGSLTCPHCQHFAETALKPLFQDYIRTGKASYEFRSFILNGPDLAATLV